MHQLRLGIAGLHLPADHLLFRALKICELGVEEPACRLRDDQAVAGETALHSPPGSDCWLDGFVCGSGRRLRRNALIEGDVPAGSRCW
jgi:hypothetical protein